MKTFILLTLLALSPSVAMAKDKFFLPYPSDRPLPLYMFNEPTGRLVGEDPSTWIPLTTLPTTPTAPAVPVEDSK